MIAQCTYAARSYAPAHFTGVGTGTVEGPSGAKMPSPEPAMRPPPGKAEPT